MCTLLTQLTLWQQLKNMGETLGSGVQSIPWMTNPRGENTGIFKHQSTNGYRGKANQGTKRGVNSGIFQSLMNPYRKAMALEILQQTLK